MRAVLVHEFGGRPVVAEVPVPAPGAGGVLLAVRSTGVCRSDWHAWLGHHPGSPLPHVPGHELGGTIAAVGPRGTDGGASATG